MGDPITNNTEIGLKIEVILEETEGDGPMIMKFHYLLNTLQFKEWLKDHKYLCGGPLSFQHQGIQVMIPKGADAWDKAGFSFNDQHGQPIFIPLLHHEAIFHTHRDITHGKEWTITYITAALAAHYSSNEG